MPSPKHLCAHPECSQMICHAATHCKKHVIKTPEWVAKVAAANKGKECSPEHRLAISIAKSGPGKIARTCPVCEKEFTVDKPSRKTIYCSRTCGYKQRQGEGANNWNPNMPIVICRVCGKSFRVTNTIGKRFTCSWTCRNIWMLTHQKTTGTNIEKAMQTALDLHKINYIPQHPLCNSTIADFYIPAINLAIFCDGDYWHSRPEKQTHDKKKTSLLIDNGFNVCRFLGSRILKDIDSCIAEIKRVSTSCT